MDVADVKKVERIEVKDNMTEHLTKLDNWSELALKYKGIEQYENVSIEDIKINEEGELEVGEGREQFIELTPIEFPNLEVEEDGWLGVPKFSQMDLDILKRIGVDIEGMAQYGTMMKEALEDKKNAEIAFEEWIKERGNDEDEMTKKLDDLLKFNLDNSIFNYHHNRNILILHKIGATEYAQMIKENQEEIIKPVNSAIDKAIDMYINSVETKEEDVEYTGHNLVQVMTYRALKNVNANVVEDFIYELAKSKTPIDFEKSLLRSLNHVANNLSNLQNSYSLKELGGDEIATVKAIRTICNQFRIHCTKVDIPDVQPTSCKADDLCNFFMLNLRQVEASTAHTEYREEQRKYKKEAKNLERENKKLYGSSKFHSNKPFNDLFIRKRFVAVFTDMRILKKMFIGSLVLVDPTDNNVTDQSLVSDVEVLRKEIDKITQEQMFTRSVKAAVSTFIYHFIFEEFQKIVDIFHNLCQEEVEGIVLVKKGQNHQFKRLRHYLCVTCFGSKNCDEHKYLVDSVGENDNNDRTQDVNRCLKIRRVYQEYITNLIGKLQNYSVNLDKFV